MRLVFTNCLLSNGRAPANEKRVLAPSFVASIRSQLQPRWHQLPARVKQLVYDARQLRELMDYLLRYDCVSFYYYLETLNSMQRGPLVQQTQLRVDAGCRFDQHQLIGLASMNADAGGRLDLPPLAGLVAAWLLAADVLARVECSDR